MTATVEMCDRCHCKDWPGDFPPIELLASSLRLTCMRQLKRLLKTSFFLIFCFWLFKPYYAWLPIERLGFGEPTFENFLLVDDQDFERLGRPGWGDWLAEHSEWGQSFWSFLQSDPVRPGGLQNEMVLQPLGAFDSEQTQVLEHTRKFCEIFFARPVSIAEPLALDPKFSRSREHGLQYRTPSLLNEVLKPRRPPEAFCYLGVTVEDLTYRDDWNFVYGSAMMKGQIGVFSLARYFPEFYEESNDGESKLGEPDSRVLRRSCGVMAHEAAHSLGLAHCVYYRCLMQGSNHLKELDEKPLYLCPICLAKLKWSLGFDLEERYARLDEFFEDHGMKKETAWLRKRLERRQSLLESP